MKKIYSFLSLTLLAGAAIAFAAAPTLTPRPERARTAKPLSSTALKISGGSDGTKQLYGATSYTEFSEAFPEWQGVAAIDANGNHTKVSGDLPETFSGCYFNGWFLAFDWRGTSVGMTIYDAETWDVSLTANYLFPIANILPFDVTFDPTSSRIYGSFAGTDTESYAIDEVTNLCYIEAEPNKLNVLAPTTVVGPLDVRMRGMAANAEGVLYGIGEDNNLYTINKTDASLTLVAPITWDCSATDTAPFYLGYESAEFDWETGTLYFSMNEMTMGDPFIFTIDTTTGQTELVANFSYEFGGTATSEVFSAIFFKQTAAANAASPAKVSDLQVTAVGTELKADVKFTLPVVTSTDEPLTGTVDWIIAYNDTELTRGTAEAGAAVAQSVSVPAEGFGEIAVTAVKGGVAGPAERKRVFFGCDTPVIPNLPDVYPDGNEVAVTWPEAYAAEGGNLAPVTYKVVRMPDQKVVAESTAETLVTDIIDIHYKDLFTYEVTPLSATKVGQAVASRPEYLGEVFRLPHSDSFEDAVLFRQYPVIDANSDGNTWDLYPQYNAAAYSANANAANDYLCIGPFDMIAGGKYALEFTADGHNRVETVAAYVGTNPDDVATFATEVVSPTDCDPNSGKVSLNGSFAPETTGKYYFAIKACSPASTTRLYVYNVTVTGTTLEMPAAPALESKPTASGIEFTITAPTTTLGGDANPGVSALRLFRDAELIAEITEGVADGAAVTYTDVTTAGKHTYKALAVNAAGEGDATYAEVYAGLDQPGPATAMRVWEDANTPGLIHLTWQAPTTSVNGGYFDPEAVEYHVSWLSLGPAGSGEKAVGSDLSFDLQLPADAVSTQGIIAFSIDSYNAAGTGGIYSRITHSTYIGPALPLPLRENFANARYSSGLWSNESAEDINVTDGFWDFFSGNSQDSDGYSIALTAEIPGGGSRKRSPRVTLANTENPTLAFYYYYTNNTASFAVQIAVEDQPMTTIKELELPATGITRWRRVEIDLTPYKSAKYVQFGLLATGKNAASLCAAFDNFNILDKTDSDIAVLSTAASLPRVDYNTPVKIAATLLNKGFNDLAAGDYTVVLSKNGKPFMEKSGPALPSLTDRVVEFTDAALPTDPSTNVYSVEVLFEADVNPADNSGAPVSVEVNSSAFPAPQQLTAANSPEGVELKWAEPDGSLLPGTPVTETFDSYEPFITDGIGNWTVYDLDEAPTAIIYQTFFGQANYPHVGEPMAWQVLNPDEAYIFLGAWYPKSGSNMLVSFQACTDGTRRKACNDWLVSPELDPAAQTISFFGRAGTRTISSNGETYAASPEIVDIMVSSTGTAVEDFTPLYSDVEIDYYTEWQEFRFDLPAGTKHFAIVHKSFDKFALLLDDLTYVPAGAERPVSEVSGYNVYRDGVRISAEPVESLFFTDYDTEANRNYTYHVTALWGTNESNLSNGATILTASIGEVNADSIAISVRGRNIVVSGAQGLSVGVYTPAGTCVSVTPGADLTEIPVAAPGIYIVKAGTRVVKLMVK